MSIKKEQKKRSKAIIEALEPRILFSADMLGGLVDGNVPDDPLAGLLEDSAILIDSSRSSDNQAQEPMGATPDRQQDQQQETADPLLIPSTENETEIQTYELLVVDTATPDYQQLIDSLVEDTSRRFELLLIEKDDNGLQL
ncbi:MAG: LEPR-XLL domain-containing protein, partial [Candidatus Thiodiazotropha sp.]